MCAVQTPMPLISINDSITASSERRARRSSVQRPFVDTLRQIEDVRRLLFGKSCAREILQDSDSKSAPALVRPGPRRSSSFLRMASAAFPEICCDRMEYDESLEPVVFQFQCKRTRLANDLTHDRIRLAKVFYSPFDLCRRLWHKLRQV